MSKPVEAGGLGLVKHSLWNIALTCLGYCLEKEDFLDSMGVIYQV